MASDVEYSHESWMLIMAMPLIATAHVLTCVYPAILA